MSEPPVVIGLGEVLWDVFPDSRRPGGAPANVAFQANQLGNHGLVASRIGDDSLGRELTETLSQKGLDLSLLQTDPTHATGRVSVDVSDGGHPDYVIHEDVAWDFLEAPQSLRDVAARAASICFGTLAQRCDVSRETIHSVLAASSDDCLVVYDVNLRQDWYQASWIERSLNAANVVKLNREEASLLAPLLGIDAPSHLTFARNIIERFGISLVCITRAEDGCLLVSAEETIDLPGQPVDVVDAVGAGDAFTAALITARLNHWPLAATARFANSVGGLVASHAGAMPPLRDQLAALRGDCSP